MIDPAHAAAGLGAETVGGRLARLRAERGLSQRAVALAAGVTPAHLSRIERGERRPSLQVLRRLAIPLDVTPDYLESGQQAAGDDTDLTRLLTALSDCRAALERASLLAEAVRSQTRGPQTQSG